MAKLSKAELDALVEQVVVDAYDEYEQFTAFHVVIEDNLAVPFQTTVLGVEVSVTKIDLLPGSGIVAICTRDKTTRRPASSTCHCPPLPRTVPNGSRPPRHSASDDETTSPASTLPARWRSADQGSISAPRFTGAHHLCWLEHTTSRLSRTLKLEVQIMRTDQGYRPMTIADLAVHLAGASDDETRWRLIAEFLEEYRHEPMTERMELLTDEPATSEDQRWDVLLAALAEHLAARDGRGAPPWAEPHRLGRFWFPFNTPSARADAIVHAPAAFRRRGVFVASQELEVA
ncbi:hypothetical protein GCM10010191_12970 [Actinomadura vinacea]|uniref:Uncharacterized protein n=1 Tax=Actinomadura vinacea TaxID=115336 RepID=A0ABN3IJ89_9ACTN